LSTDSDIKKSTIVLNSYRLQKGDLLSIQISSTTEQEHDFFNKETTANSQLLIRNPYLYGYLIKDDGKLELPSFGHVQASGYTLRELESIIKNIAVSYFDEPVVKINIINFDVTVLGEVQNPGTFQINNPDLNLLYALSLANDITEFGNRKRVKVIRKNDDISRVFYVDLTDQKMLNSEDFMLQPKDIIYVEPLKKKFFAFKSVTNFVSLSISAITLFLLITKE
tara:strand:+ start:917 stop:1588 length:672 start_codon:yes stop_codon:yes gene_type:complete